MRLVRDLTLALTGALAITLAVAARAALRIAAEQGWIAAGFYRLIVRTAWDHFDAWLPLAAAAALVVAALAQVVHWWRGRLAPTRLRGALAPLALLAALRAGTALETWHAPRGPNLLLVSIDTLRADHLGAYGYTLPTSPVIDRRLAAEGVTFEEVYSQSPKTTPSHMTLLTSLYPSVHGIEMWQAGTPGQVLNPRVHTLAEVLKDAGYATAAFTGGANLDRSRGFNQGFDLYKQNDQLARARRWLGAHRGRKFFLFFHTYAVHDPYVPPPDLVAAFAPDYRGPVLDALARLRAGKGGWWDRHRLFWKSVDAANPRDVEFVARLYDAAIRDMDGSWMAPLLDELDALGLSDRTLVVFTGDHGEAFGEHGVFLHDDLYRGTLRVPLILRLPDRLPAGRRVAAPAALIDVMPTVLGLLGVPAPPAVEGRNLAPLALAAEPDPGAGDVVSEYSQPESGRIYETLRRGRLTYMVDAGREALFDRGADPEERTDILAAEPALAEPLRAGLARWHAAAAPLAARLGPRGDGVVPSVETARRLRALGYIE